MKKNEYVVILIYSISYALRIEKVLQQAGITCKLIPVPRHLSSNCGVCVRIKPDDRENALQALERVRMEIDSIHSI